MKICLSLCGLTLSVAVVLLGLFRITCLPSCLIRSLFLTVSQAVGTLGTP